MRIEVVRAPEPLGSWPGLAAAIDALGKKSAIAQALSHEITSADLVATSEQRQTLTLAVDDGDVVGFLKTGVKHLFYMSPRGEYTEMDPICVLDFYVDEAWQRRGVGLQLFHRLLQEEGVTPAQLAYDRPSPKLFAFLKKHAGLTEHFPQPNRFVVFDAYFQPCQ
ncbi:Alpha-tubulin N-acetyltransferase 1 [Phytophthora pseudosyringae]|uniref:Alpha-tubulin N-acetyltransferase n=1 Tax=Phytophthora pseudosyringae TaxID=221518 RepID=A0A8T1VZ85_9STRA|nr:Alpha-tubulin N-acetyltransferase 1 [Phytophthora pseudosyringae]